MNIIFLFIEVKVTVKAACIIIRTRNDDMVCNDRTRAASAFISTVLNLHNPDATLRGLQ